VSIADDASGASAQPAIPNQGAGVKSNGLDADLFWGRYSEFLKKLIRRAEVFTCRHQSYPALVFSRSEREFGSVGIDSAPPQNSG
jgi:hypothetical protein